MDTNKDKAEESSVNAEPFPAACGGVSRVGLGRRLASPASAGLCEPRVDSPGLALESSAGGRAAVNDPSKGSRIAQAKFQPAGSFYWRLFASICGLLLHAHLHAASLNVLYNFTTSNQGGSNPQAALVQGSDGNFYGTSSGNGSSNNGTVFKMTPAGVLTTLVSFTGANGANPCAGLVQGTDGNFYGTTSAGGSSNDGTVFQMTPAGALTILFSFNGANGANPCAGLVQGGDGNFYGTTSAGGGSNDGTVFKMTSAGVLTTLVLFNSANGANPYAGLVQGSDGNFYGTTYHGGSGNEGTVFMVTPAGVWTTLVSFSGTNGANPYAGLVKGSNGSFYGTTSGGGTLGNGVAFQLIIPQAAALVFSPVAGTYTSVQTVTITSATNGASIYYTTDGSLPSETNGTLYSGAVDIGANTTLNAIAYESGFGDSAVTSGVYTITLPPLPYATDFEVSEGYSIGSLNGQQGWTSSADITGSNFFSGAQSVILQPNPSLSNISHQFSSDPSQPIVFVDFYAIPVADPDPDNATQFWTDSVNGLAVKNVEGHGEVYVFDGNGDDIGRGWVDTGYVIPLNANNQAAQWVRFTLRSDYSAHTWDLYVNKQMVIADVLFPDPTVNQFSSFGMLGYATIPSYLDHFSAGYVNPLFADANNDGIDDVWETANGLSLSVNDRYGQFNGDGLTNLQQYISDLYYNGVMPTITSQVDPSGIPGAQGLVSVLVTDAGGSPLVNALLTFSVTTGASQISATPGGAGATTISVSTDSNGMAQAYLNFTSNTPDVLVVTVPNSIPATSISINVNPPYTTDFEVPGYSLGSLAGQQGWGVTQGAASITNQGAYSGSQSVVLQPGTIPAQIVQTFPAITGENILYVDFYTMPVAETAVTAATTFDVGNARFAFVLSGSGLGILEAFNGDGAGSGGGTWTSTNFAAPLGTNNQTQSWIELTARLDFTHKTWDLYANGQMVVADMGFRDNTSTYLASFIITGDVATATEFDTFSIQTTNPLFANISNDGIADTWKTEYNLDSQTNDRYLDPTSSGYTVLYDYINGINPNPVVYTITPLANYSNQLGNDGMIAVTVTPSYGNTLSGVSVQFTTSPGNLLTTNPYGSGQSASLTVTTDSNGVAFVYVRPNPNDPNTNPGSTSVSVDSGQTATLIQHPAGTPPGAQLVSRSLSVQGADLTSRTVTITLNPVTNKETKILSDGTWIYTFTDSGQLVYLQNTLFPAIPAVFPLVLENGGNDDDYSATFTETEVVTPPGLPPQPPTQSGAQGENAVADLYNFSSLLSAPVVSNVSTVTALDSIKSWDQTTSFKSDMPFSDEALSAELFQTWMGPSGSPNDDDSTLFAIPLYIPPDLPNSISAETFSKAQYQFNLGQNSPPTITWLEEFSSTDGSPSTVNFMSWTPLSGVTQSPIYTIDPLGLDPSDTNAKYRHPTEAGTWQVLPFQVELAVDANRDGEIHFASENVGPSLDDSTSAAKPFRFWLNDGIDGPSTDPGESAVQDSLDPSSGTPNCQQGRVTCTRDLENFARLWMSTKGLSQAISSGQITVGLEWQSNTGDEINGWGPNDGAPAINIYNAAPKVISLGQVATNTGGSDYLTDTNTADYQWGSGYGVALGTVAKGQPFYIPATTFANLTDANPQTYFLFEGVTRGTGRLVITLNTGSPGNYTKICDGESVYLDLKDIKEFYERWTVGEGNGGAPVTPAGISSARLPTGVQQGLQYSSGDPGLSVPGDPNQNAYILLVHGWNMPPWERDAFAETALKRLYWQGYKGKFGAFEWPTTYTTFSNEYFSAAQKIAIYDDGEYSAWQSGAPLEQLLGSLHGAYGGNVYLLAHSMGNVVSGEALRIAGQSEVGQLVNTYVASQAAVPGECYDPSLTGSDPLSFHGVFGPYTPDIYGNWLAPVSAAVQAKANFYNVNDYALGYWQLDQATKPDIGSQVYYYASSDLTTVQDLFKKSTYPDPVTAALIITSHTGIFPTSLHLGDAANIQDRYQILAYDAQPRSLALGAVPDAAQNGVFASSQNLQDSSIWPPDTFAPDNQPQNQYAEHQWHSAEFRFTNADQTNYWHALLGANGFDLLP